MNPRDLLIYTDGACSGNPGPGGWAAIILDRAGRVRELGGSCGRTTNNRMELTAAIEALRAAADSRGRAALYSDSSYLVAGVTRWLPEWKSRGWARKDGAAILNRDLWEELDRLVSRQGISWNYVRGHKGHAGNSRCDEIAVAFSKGEVLQLYDGPVSGCPVDLTPPKPQALPLPSGRRPAGVKKAGWYLSLLDGRLEKHRTWADCRARVHGRPARFKKVGTREEEAALLDKWGLA